MYVCLLACCMYAHIFRYLDIHTICCPKMQTCADYYPGSPQMPNYWVRWTRIVGTSRLWDCLSV